MVLFFVVVEERVEPVESVESVEPVEPVVVAAATVCWGHLPDSSCLKTCF